MSKSDKDVNSRIDIVDSNDDISAKIQRAVTDSEDYIHTLDGRPGVQNLLNIYSAFSSNLTFDIVTNKYKDTQYFTRPLKKDLTELIVRHLQPIREKYNDLIDNKEYLEKVLIDGSNEANIIAQETMKDVYTNVGMR